ncbi:hypothetical protein Poli38472_013626 [Pythium oligandrum]|uniref:Tubulin--tyrosine ligase-like protein 5 n=1 Tax=Pythium oligandrum TaxID=41045 RepID=A0A8K1CEN4_PYTOL|nr:hypothetical protein Poli38472_013626 [Pythium oligandrum]|eukprot:TMW61163.1 hypothetical protein Poli38472_013626 [Pythium oligandrum]
MCLHTAACASGHAVKGFVGRVMRHPFSHGLDTITFLTFFELMTISSLRVAMAPLVPPPSPTSVARGRRRMGPSDERKKQMETRLRLRRRLLRIDPDASLSAAMASTHVSTRVGATSLLRRRLRASMAANDSGEDEVGEEEDGDGDAVDEDEDGEEEEEDEDDGADADSSSVDDHTAVNAQGDGALPVKPKNEKCETSSVVKLLCSRANPRGRPPTVWFDYPPHLQVTREDPAALASTTAPRLVAINATDCELFYKTHWERNCVKNAFAVAGFRRTKKRWRGWHMAWAKHIPRERFKYFGAGQVFNHFPDPWVIGRKDRLTKTLTTYKRRFGESYAFFPEGFTLPDQWDSFKRTVQRDEESSNATRSSRSSLWIVKPPAAACGRGIRVLAAKDVESFIAKDRQQRKYVIQRYLSSPLLLDGYKFDLRLYVVVTSVDPLRVYLFQEGLTRICTSRYSLGNLKNRFSHLTNYSVNKQNAKFVENTDGNEAMNASKWSLTTLLEHLVARGVVPDSETVMQRIRSVICKTIIAAEAHLAPLMHQCVKGSSVQCYELFGFDLMLDEQCMPWLIEANVSPSLMGSSPLDKRVKGLLLSDIFHLVGVPVPVMSLPADAVPKDWIPRADAVKTTTTPSPGPDKRRTGSVRAINKQLHEVVLDPNVASFDKQHLALFTASDWDMVHSMDDEMDRLGHFERIFPCATPQESAQYAPFFACPRYGNALCAKWLETCRLAKMPKKLASSSLSQRHGSRSVKTSSRGNDPPVREAPTRPRGR